jgi:hypothetical protein
LFLINLLFSFLFASLTVEAIVLGHGLAEAGVQHLMADVQIGAAQLMKATVFKYWTEYDGYAPDEGRFFFIFARVCVLLVFVFVLATLFLLF